MQIVENVAQTDVLVIVGPTAVGKTAVAIELSGMIGGEIVSADSMAVYKDMNLGTAKPTLEEQSKARFHLIDVVDPEQPFNVGEFQRLAQVAIDDIIRRNPPAIVVGGSGLYVRAAIDGLDESVPASQDEVRQRLNQEAQEFGKLHMHARLAAADSVTAQRIHPNNVKRVLRALEIYELSGTKPSEMFEEHAKRSSRYPNARFFGLAMNRDTLYTRIEDRVDAMIEAGLVDEVRGLVDRISDPNSISMQGLGYKEIAAFLCGDLSLDEAIALLKKNTRRFAKRQYTWFRADDRIIWINVDGLTVPQVSQLIKETLSNE